MTLNAAIRMFDLVGTAREGKVERHIRRLAPLAFASPRIVLALLDGTAPAVLTLTKIARALPQGRR
jgi:hypothetical protein